MIGNMWVIPENATRPSDARTKKPTVRKMDTKDTEVRRELKKLLKSLYRIAEDLTNEETEKKHYVLVSIAVGLCGYYIGEDSLSDNIKRKISEDLTGYEESFVNEDILREISAFISRYEEDKELDNLLSWAYQYSNKIVKDNVYSQTQFFTEKYMIDYLVDNISEIQHACKIVDPCTGGGNFLVECYEALCGGYEKDVVESLVIANADKLYGYDIDCDITRVALVLAVFNSIVFDYIVRLKMAGLDLTQTIVRQIPVPEEERYEHIIIFSGVEASIEEHINSRMKVLYTSDNRMSGLFEDTDTYVLNSSSRKAPNDRVDCKNAMKLS